MGMESEREGLLPTSPTPHEGVTPVIAITSTPMVSPVVERDEQEEVRLEETSRVGKGSVGGERSLPHSESRHSLGARHGQARPSRARRQKSAQLPAHGEVQRMESSLLKLLDQFNSGQLRAFDKSMLVQMEEVRDQQEGIARRHFELGAEQDLHPPLSDDGLAMATENMGQLMGSLETLSLAIGQLSSLDRLGQERVSRPEGREGSTMSCEPLYTRRSTMSRDSTQGNDNEDYLDRLSQRTLV